jgi:glycosyltransferase involved in cell wall biosynthesis
MPLYRVEPGSLEVQQSYEKSPVVSLLTDARSESDVPSPVREASDRVVKDGLPELCDFSVPAGSDAAILWIAGDQLLNGSSALLRHEAFLQAGRIFVPVHLPGPSALDLVGLQPRIWTKNRNRDVAQSKLRISGAVTASPAAVGFLEESREHWAHMYRALLTSQHDAASAFEWLSKMWRDRSIMHPVLGALLLRNLVVLSFQENKLERIETLLNAGMDCYPRCAELTLLAAWTALERGDLRKAQHYAKQARENPDPKFIGAGGETSYRALWLLGLTAELEGKQRKAVFSYLAGLVHNPAFPPSVYGLLRQRLPHAVVRELCSRPLVRLASREPQYCEPIFQFLSLHGQIQALHELVSSANVSPELREKFQKLIDEKSATARERPRGEGDKSGLRLKGPFYVHSSLARINREIGAALTAASEFELSADPSDFGDALGMHLPHYDSISQALKSRLSRLDLTIRQQWPPDLSPPACGKLVVLLPWEFGAVPRRWVEEIENHVDELWLPSEFTREVFVRAGVRPARIQVIPYGIDTEIFKREGPAWRPKSSRRFVFLFVGGAILRKGADVLWAAYEKAFSIGDDVTLVIKDVGARTYYSGQSVVDEIRVAARKPRSPHVVILEDEIDDKELAALYRGCDILALPYRGEGFGLPLAEALACGKPVIATGLGPAREFCPPEATFFIPARVVEFYNPQDLFGPLSGANSVFEPDVDELARTMRYVFERAEEVGRRGAQVANKVREKLSWTRVTGMYIERIHHLLALQGIRDPGTGTRVWG